MKLLFSAVQILTNSKQTAAEKAIVDNKSKVTEAQLKTFLDLCWVKYVKARIEPGELCADLFFFWFAYAILS